MKLSKTEIQTFFKLIRVSPGGEVNSLEFLNLIILKVAETIPWQNVVMVEKYFETIPDFENIKENLLSGKGGICLDINRFMFYFLKSIGFEIQYVLCGRNKQEKRHIALVVHLNNNPYFVDFGDAQPYYQAINLTKSNLVISRGSNKYKIEKKENQFYLMINKSDKWEILYLFDLKKYSEFEFTNFIKEYYSNVFYGPFWKEVHFAYYPNKKLRAIKGTTILVENNNGEIIKIKHSCIEEFNENLKKYFSTEILQKFDFIKVIEKLIDINSKERFGLNLSKSEVDYFLNGLEIKSTEISVEFIKKLTSSVLQKIPFQNYKMIERKFGHIPTEKEIKDDMLSFNGGTCATMNTFLGALLYRLGFNVVLVSGTMAKENDHIAILLSINNEYYTLDFGDGQPYFEPLPINQENVYKHPFRTFRTQVSDKALRIDFLINKKWATDVTLHIIPKTFNQIYRTLEQHYTQKEFGPFWNGIRFAIYPNKEIIAIRDNTFIIQESNLIEKIEIKDYEHLTKLLTKYLPNFKDQIDLCFKTLRILC